MRHLLKHSGQNAATWFHGAGASICLMLTVVCVVAFVPSGYTVAGSIPPLGATEIAERDAEDPDDGELAPFHLRRSHHIVKKRSPRLPTLCPVPPLVARLPHFTTSALSPAPADSAWLSQSIPIRC